MQIDKSNIIGVIGAGTMGAGIAQVAAQAGNQVVVFDANQSLAAGIKPALGSILAKLRDKGKITVSEEEAIQSRVAVVADLTQFTNCNFIIEAIIEDLAVKQELFRRLEEISATTAIFATNTSSLSVTAIAGAIKHPERMVGVHFFNPAPLLPLVEIVPGLRSSCAAVDFATKLVSAWGKTPVLAKDTPGFIVNRIARPFYGESLRILEEGIADYATIDWAMKEFGKFRMGPFELMDLIGNDINYKVTTSVFESFYYDPRYRPSLYQKRMVDAGLLGRKSGRGYYNYGSEAETAEAVKDSVLGEQIFQRVLAMLINEAADALYLKIASAKDIETAMTRGVNYPQGLLRWANDFSIPRIVAILDGLIAEYSEDRYRVSPLLRKMVRSGENFII